MNSKRRRSNRLSHSFQFVIFFWPSEKLELQIRMCSAPPKILQSAEEDLFISGNAFGSLEDVRSNRTDFGHSNDIHRCLLRTFFQPHPTQLLKLFVDATESREFILCVGIADKTNHKSLVGRRPSKSKPIRLEHAIEETWSAENNNHNITE